MSDLHALFQVGDVIEITNDDRPDWVKGRWRVLEVVGRRVRLLPVLEDGRVDLTRWKSGDFWIRG